MAHMMLWIINMCVSLHTLTIWTPSASDSLDFQFIHSFNLISFTKIKKWKSREKNHQFHLPCLPAKPSRFVHVCDQNVILLVINLRVVFFLLDLVGVIGWMYVYILFLKTHSFVLYFDMFEWEWVSKSKYIVHTHTYKQLWFNQSILILFMFSFWFYFFFSDKFVIYK